MRANNILIFGLMALSHLICSVTVDNMFFFFKLLLTHLEFSQFEMDVN